MNILLLRFGIIAAIVVVIVIAVFALALWLHRRGSLGQASRRAAPLARRAAQYRARSGPRSRGDIVSAGLTTLANALEKSSQRDDDTGASR